MPTWSKPFNTEVASSPARTASPRSWCGTQGVQHALILDCGATNFWSSPHPAAAREGPSTALPTRRHPRLTAGKRELVQAARAAKRRKVAAETDKNFLKRSVVSKATQVTYSTAIYDFGLFRKQALRGKEPHDRLDQQLDAYITRLFFDGAGTAEARIALYAVAWWLTLPTRSPLILPLAKAALKGFNRWHPDNTKDPGPWEAACLLAMQAATQHGSFGVMWAAMTLVMFDLYLRPVEGLTLQFQHVVAPTKRGQRCYQQYAVIVCPSTEHRTTKTRTQDDTVVVGNQNPDRQFVAKVVGALKTRARRPGTPLTPLDHQAYADFLFVLAKDTGLGQLKLTPHSWRHGGPSTDYLAKAASLTDIQRRGRWQCAASVRRYEKQGKLLRQVALMSPDQLSAARSAQLWLEQHLARLIMQA